MSTAQRPTTGFAPVTPTATLDVRPILAAGDEPFGLIMRTVRDLPDGATFALTAPFEPAPLYDVLAPQGWAHRVVAVDVDGSVTVHFTATGITADSTPAELVARHPQLQPVLDAFGIDQCCGGAKSLATIATAHGLALPALLDALHDAAIAG